MGRSSFNLKPPYIENSSTPTHMCKQLLSESLARCRSCAVKSRSLGLIHNLLVGLPSRYTRERWIVKRSGRKEFGQEARERRQESDYLDSRLPGSISRSRLRHLRLCFNVNLSGSSDWNRMKTEFILCLPITKKIENKTQSKQNSQ